MEPVRDDLLGDYERYFLRVNEPDERVNDPMDQLRLARARLDQAAIDLRNEIKRMGGLMKELAKILEEAKR